MRRRYRWNEATQQMEELSSGWSDAETRAPVATEGLVYGNIAPATDGTQLDSRRKHSEYMKRNNLSLTSDFEGHWKQAATERERFNRGDFDRQERRQQVGRAMYNAWKGRK